MTHVYLAGEVITGSGVNSIQNAEVWTDGVGTPLATTAAQSGVHAITLLGSDVYVGGWQGDGINNQAMIWKNGVAVPLTVPTGYSEIFGIASSGSDVYAVGVSPGSSGYSAATLWKNGVPTYLADAGYGSFAHGLAVSGSDVYVTGTAFPPNGPYFASLWKNGLLTNLSGQQYSAQGLSVAVSNGDVYVSGDADIAGSGSIGQPVYWKNGALVQLSTLDGQAYSLVVSGSDVYVGGDLDPASSNPGGGTGCPSATVWTNGTSTSYNDGAVCSGIPGIAVSGGDVYAPGGMRTSQGYQGGYWKNGVLTVIAPGDVSPEAIVVTQE